MKLADKFFNSFFYTFLFGVILSFISTVIFSIFFTTKYIDKKTVDNIIKLEQKLSKINLNSMNVLITSSIYKIQSSLNELIIAYQNMASKVKNNDNFKINITNNKFFKGLLDLTPTFLEDNYDYMEYIAYWILDEFTNEKNVRTNSTEEKQIFSISEIIDIFYTNFYATSSTSICYYFYFDSSELFISYPLIYDYESEYLEVLRNYDDNQPWCTDENGHINETYKAKCRDFYRNIQKAKTSIFDNNSKDNNNRTIFVTDFYQDLGQEKSANIFTMCIQFKDPISNQSGYACAGVGRGDVISDLGGMNSKMSGYFFAALVGFDRLFCFPQMMEVALTPSEAIFTDCKEFFLGERCRFIKNARKIVTSNCVKYINDSIWDEISMEKKIKNNIFILMEKKIIFLYIL